LPLILPQDGADPRVRRAQDVRPAAEKNDSQLAAVAPRENKSRTREYYHLNLSPSYERAHLCIAGTSGTPSFHLKQEYP
jgi:hypothetical protein